MPKNVPPNLADLCCTEQYDTQYPVKSDVPSHRWYFEDAAFYRDATLTLVATYAAAMPARRPPDIGGRALLT